MQRAADANDNERRTNDNNVELEPALQELVLNLLSDGVETNIRLCADFFSYGGHYGSRECAGATTGEPIFERLLPIVNLTSAKHGHTTAVAARFFSRKKSSMLLG